MVNKTTDTPENEQPELNNVSSADSIYNASKAAERLENANKKLAELLAIQEQTQVKKTLDGNADTGLKQETEDEKEIKDAKRFLDGTGLEEWAFPDDKK